MLLDLIWFLTLKIKISSTPDLMWPKILWYKHKMTKDWWILYSIFRMIACQSWELISLKGLIRKYSKIKKIFIPILSLFYKYKNYINNKWKNLSLINKSARVKKITKIKEYFLHLKRKKLIILVQLIKYIKITNLILSTIKI
jgi:hypothetical protein